MNGAEARARLLSLLRERALLRGDFVLSSGRHSSYYLDARIVTLSAEGSGLVGTVFLDALAGAGVQAAAGLTMGADPIVSAIAVVAGLHGDARDGLIIRKEPKSHGVGRQIEGPWREGLRVAVVDDTLTTGASCLTAARALAEAGGVVAGVYALIDREEGAREAIEAAGYQYHPIFHAHEIVAR